MWGRTMKFNEFNYFYTSKFNFELYEKLFMKYNCYFLLWQFEC